MKFILWIAQLGLGILAFLRSARDKEVGKLEEQNKNMSEALDDVTKANDIVDHYKHDAEFRNRVQDRFKRK